MCAMGELTFFLGLQVKQQPDGIFISQAKYVQDMLRRFDMESVRPATTPYEAAKPKSKDEPDDAVNVHLYRSMIVKKIFKYLKGQPKLGLWYQDILPWYWKAYSDSDLCWCKKQTVVQLLPPEVEYVGCASLLCEMIHDWAYWFLLAEQFLLVVFLVSAGRVVPAGLLHDEGGIVDMPIPDILLGMDNLGYPTEGKLTFHKNKFTPQWRFLIHTLLHCLSTKSGSWDQFGIPLAIALICLCEGKKFLQLILDIETRSPKPYHAFRLTSKMFANMRLNFHGDHMPLVAAMLPPPQAAIILWGDLHVLFESTTGGSSVEVWNDQQEWVIHSWKLFPFSGVHVLETFTGKILYMFADTPYPLSASLMKKMLKHKLEVEIDGAFGWFLGFLRYVVPTGRVIATVSIKVPAGYIISPGLKDLSRAETYKWYQSLERVSVEE
ncbi:hypothetical protein Tco_0792040 [Tanacetum coccineum]